MFRKVCFGIAAVTALAVSQPAFAGAVVSGFNANSLARNDDDSTGSVGIGFTVNYFGVSNSNLFVNNNGNLTFGSPLSTFTPFGTGASYIGLPIIAPFFADVDTRNGASNLVTYGAGTFDGRTAFGANWVDVGYYDARVDKLNSFQTLLVDRSDVSSGDFDIYFNYDKIQWETGQASGGTDGLGGESAGAGFSNGTGVAGSFYELPGSRVNGALLDGGPNSLVAGSNIGTPGRYLFQVRNGSVIVPGAVPEPGTWAMMLLGFFALGAAMRQRKTGQRTTVSVRYA